MIGKRIKLLRGGDAIATFANAMGVHRNTLPKYESGERTPGGDFLVKLCSVYNVRPSWLLLGEEPMRDGDLAKETTGTTDLHIGREAQPTPAPPKTAASPLDEDLLAAAIEAIEEALVKSNRHMKPKKKAELIAAVYDLYSGTGLDVAKKCVLKFLKVAI